jgi:hypothetical protein
MSGITAFGVSGPLDDALIVRIRARAADPATRTDESPTVFGGSVSFGSFTVQGIDPGSVLAGRSPADEPVGRPDLRAPVAETALLEAEGRLGFALPVALRRLYAEIADGGFGPGAGLLPLEDLVRTFLELRAEPAGPEGEEWPATLLPITSPDPGHECLHLETGALVFWDVERLADEEWEASFVAEAPDLGTWLERWLERPAPETELRQQLEGAMLNGVKESLDYWRAKTPEERAAFGLPEVGWEEELFGHLGIDLRSL